MDYRTALERVMSLADFERSARSSADPRFHLDRIGLMLHRLGDPHLDTPTIHIAGTKGKGSTAALIASALSDHGYRTGLYTSPHLHTIRERIRVGQEAVTEEEFCTLVERVWPVVEWVGQEGCYGEATTFELLTAMAFLHFKEVGADFQVVEVGMGGRLDTTNVVRPEVCVLTSISLDHTEILGDTLERIALEKAGIIKAGTTAVAAPQPLEAMRVFQRVAEEKGAKLVSVSQDMSWQRESSNFDGQSFNVRGPHKGYRLWIPLLGEHQLENTCTALAALESLRERGFLVSDESISQGFRDVQWPGRLEILTHNGRTLVVDGAHNPYSMRRMVEALREYFQFKGVIAIFGALGGHNVKGMATELAQLSPIVLATRPRHPRATPNETISQAFAEQGVQVAYETEDVGQATHHALDMAQAGDLVVGTGSLFVAAEVIEAVRGMEPELYPTLRRPSLKPLSVV